MCEKTCIGLFAKNDFITVQAAFWTYPDFSLGALVHKSLDNRHPAVLYMFFCTCREENILIYVIHYITHNLCIEWKARTGDLCLIWLTSSGRLRPPRQAHSSFQSRDGYTGAALAGTLQTAVTQHKVWMSARKSLLDGLGVMWDWAGPFSAADGWF